MARAVIGASRGTPVVAACLGMSAPDGRLAGALLAATLEGGALRVSEILGGRALDLTGSPGPDTEAAIARVGAGGTAVRGFFTGGTLRNEAQVILCQSGRCTRTSRCGQVWAYKTGTARAGGAHVCLDLGEEEYTKGLPHPMIDPAARAGDPAGAGVRRRCRGGAA